MADRRRINGPSGGTKPPLFACQVKRQTSTTTSRPTRARSPSQLRKLFLRTGVTPTAAGSSYLELEASPSPRTSLLPPSSALKLTCTIHGPRPLPRNAPFSPALVLSTHIKIAPFATRTRRGYLRDAAERDLAAHLETALRGVVVGERWPKSGLDISITVLEGEEDGWWGDAAESGEGWGMMSVLAGCVTAASAALVEAGIDCVEVVTGGVAALVEAAKGEGGKQDGDGVIVLDPNPAEHEDIKAACVVAYLSQRDELTLLWQKGEVGDRHMELVDAAVSAASATKVVLMDALTKAMEDKLSD